MSIPIFNIKVFNSFFGGLVFLFFVSSVLADGISITAQVNRNRVALGSSLTLTVTINGAKDDMAPIELPTMDGLESQYVGPSRQITIINGNYSSRLSFNYVLKPEKVGQLQIPSIAATINGQSYKTEPISMEVVDSNVNPSGQDEDTENHLDRKSVV